MAKSQLAWVYLVLGILCEHQIKKDARFEVYLGVLEMSENQQYGAKRSFSVTAQWVKLFPLVFSCLCMFV